MKKTILKIVGIIMLLLTAACAILLIATFISPGTGGFIDLTNVVRYFLIGAGLLFALIAALLLRAARRIK